MKDSLQLIDKSMRTLEFDRVLSLLQEKCGSDGSREKAAALTPSLHFDEAEERQRRTAEAYTPRRTKRQPACRRDQRHSGIHGTCCKGSNPYYAGTAAHCRSAESRPSVH